MSHFLSNEVLKLLSHIPPSFWFWLWVAVYSAGCILTLWVLSLIKNIAGWAGVVAVLLVLTYGYGYGRGYLHVPLNPIDTPIPHWSINPS